MPAGRRPGARAERRRNRIHLGAHPERRVLLPSRREALRRSRRPASAAGPIAAAVILPPVVNLYDEPVAGAPVVSQATLGTVVRLLEARSGWAFVEMPDRYQGWVRDRALRRGAPLPGSGRGDRVVEVASLFANIYREPDVTSAAPLAQAPLLARLQIAEDAGEWKKVLLPDGRAGWVHRGDLARPEVRRPTLDRSEDVAASAFRFLGLPYLWGGTTPFGLDCSGLAQLVYRLHGFLLPRDADQQFADPRLRSIGREALRPGDLVFFGPGGRGITHVGIALGGHDFVSATTYRAPAVRIDSLEDPYWAKLYCGARRAR